MVDDKQIVGSDDSAQSVPALESSGVDDSTSTDEVVAEVAEETQGADQSQESVVTTQGEADQVDTAVPTEEISPEEQEKLEAQLKAHIPWYVVHVYSGFEARVKLSLEERVRNASLQEHFGRIIVPQEKVVELVRGEKKTSTRKFFPGYILIQCELNDETWHLVKDTPKVTGFVGDSHNPVPLSPQEVQTLFEQMEGVGQKARPKVQFEDGDSVKVIDGPFADFNGTVDEVKADKGKIRVLINIFGRNTPVELDFVQVEKV
jgi:transcriptional antiterminator NusG